MARRAAPLLPPPPPPPIPLFPLLLPRLPPPLVPAVPLVLVPSSVPGFSVPGSLPSLVVPAASEQPALAWVMGGAIGGDRFGGGDEIMVKVTVVSPRENLLL